MELKYDVKIENQKGVIVVTSDLDDEQAGEALKSAFDGLVEQGLKTIVLDLRGVEIINSYGVGKIITCFKILKNAGGQLMVKPLAGFVKETFDLLMLSNLFPVDND
jgi:anti-anti-sigma factor